MIRIFTLCMMIVGFVYFLPVFTGEKALEEVTIDVLSEFSVPNIEIFEETESISVFLNNHDIKIDIDEYLIGVVAGEMPASFEEEALKAQAVAARTYVYYKQALMDSGKADNIHSQSVVCDDHTHCKAYIDLQNKNPWGQSYDIYYNKIKNAVLETSGEYIIYNDEPIAAVFHSASSGNTENAKDVWGSDFSYLVSVQSDGSKDSPNYLSSISVSFEDFKKIILEKYENAVFEDDPKTWFKASTRSDSGGVISVYVGGVLVKGSDIRTLFSLNSTNFTVEYTDTTVVFNTKGYGHGVGLSQYGANGLAKEGKTYEEILKWYYTGTEIVKK